MTDAEKIEVISALRTRIGFLEDYLDQEHNDFEAIAKLDICSKLLKRLSDLEETVRRDKKLARLKS